MERRLSAILAADVVGYSALMERDEAGTFDRLKVRRKELFEPEITRHHGRVFKLMGDGLLAEFASAVDAVECAVSLQRGMAERNDNIAPDKRFEVRIGINLGEVIVEGDDRYGEGVNIAAGLQQVAEPGGICVSRKVSREVEKRLAFGFESLGHRQIKNTAEPVFVYRVLIDRARGHELLRVEETGAANKPSIAVLPFTNMSNDPEQEYFSEGITEDIITDLSKISGLYVVPRHTAFIYKGRPIKVGQVAQDLSVRFVLEGSVRRAGSRVRVTGQLIDSASGLHLWADRYDRDLTDIFAIQDDITRAIVGQLKVRLLPEEQKAIGQAPTSSVEAYGYYLRGRQFLHRRSKTFLVLARRMFSKAVEIDPDYARAYAGIADCDSFLRLHYGADVSIDSILAMSNKALELEGDLAEARASRGLALSLLGRYADAIAEFDRAIAIDPNLFEAHYFCARACFSQGKLEQAEKHFRRAAEIKPDDCQTLLVLTGVLRSLGRIEDMKTAAREGVARAERELTLHPENPRPAYLGAGGLAILGEIDRAREWAARALAIDPDDVLTQYNGACFYAMIGEHEKAIDLLLAVLPRAGRQTRDWVKHDSDFDPLRSHPRFAEVLELIGREQD
ncbi:MAG: tetratricopeptide repeat protein [Hyphomicrobiaceae bacterium]|nr:MAG: tetratricopeptide repeat protein [Hyphomicrobiaceae bacterium]